MKRAMWLLPPLLAFGAVSVQPSTLDDEGIKKLLSGLGYEVKENKETGKTTFFEITENTEKFKIPMSFEISPSKRYLWLTVNLGEAPKDPAKAMLLLESNGEIQPTQFFITKNKRLKLGYAFENKGITAADVKKAVEGMRSDVDDTSSIWNTPASGLLEAKN